MNLVQASEDVSKRGQDELAELAILFEHGYLAFSGRVEGLLEPDPAGAWDEEVAARVKFDINRGLPLVAQHSRCDEIELATLRILFEHAYTN